MVAVLRIAPPWYAPRAVARIVLIVALALALAGCGRSQSHDSDRTTVVAAFYPLAWTAEQVGGEDVRVVNLTPAGAEPHDLELSPRDVEDVRSADVVLLLRGFQPALDRAAEDASGDVVDLLAGAAPPADPHVWLDPVRFARAVERIGEALGRRAEAEAVAGQVRELHGEYAAGLRDCERRTIVTSHASFGYLADRYGLEQVAIGGLSPEGEPAPRELEQLVEEVRATDATAVFLEPLVSPRLAQTIARETGARTAVLDPIEGLTEAQAARGEDYLSLMRANLATLRRTLGCR